jgi:hypothetical protein
MIAKPTVSRDPQLARLRRSEGFMMNHLEDAPPSAFLRGSRRGAPAARRRWCRRVRREDGGSKSRRRLGIVYIPMGMNPAPWIPRAEGRIGELSTSLASLTPHLDHLTVVTNLEVRNSAVAGGNHATAGSAFLSCARAKRTEGSDFELGITIDQILARAVGKDSPIPSLEIGTDVIPQVGNCDNGFACVYQKPPVVVVGHRRS